MAGADGIPLDDYPTAAAQNLVAVYANAALSRLILMAIALVVVVRYRRAVPAMLLVTAISFVAARLLPLLYPIARVGNPPAGVVNFAADYGECEVVTDILNRRALEICACSLRPMSVLSVQIE